MAEIQSLEGQINGGGGGGGGGGSILVTTSQNFSSKRQRRPSVRLGDIGDQQYDSNLRRTKQWSKLPLKDSNLSGKGSKTRALMNIGSSSGGGGGGNDGDYETLDAEDEGNLDSVAIGSWKVKDSKSKRGSTKRVRSSWVSKVDEGGGGGGGGGGREGGSVVGDDKYSGGEDVDDGFRDFDPEGSESPLKEQSPIHSLDNMAVDVDRGHSNDREVLFHGQRRQIRARVSEGRDHHDGVELSGPSDTDTRDWNRGTSADRNGNSGQERCLDDGVRIWLNGLGLGRYAPVFEIHEVDDEVLPMLTLEDLKDMGINAVGSRRKMYCAIQKLGQGFS